MAEHAEESRMALYKNGFKIAVACVFMAVSVTGSESTLYGQDWHISNPPVTQSQPQYRPGSTATPIENIKKLAPMLNEAPQNSVQHSPVLTHQAIVTQEFDTAPAQVNAPGSVVQSFNTPPPATPTAELNRQEPPQPYGLDLSEFRDHNRYPIAPRKPCNTCVRPPQVQAVTKHDLPGLLGRPHMDDEPGGCRCGQKSCPKCSDRSVYWPLPRSARLDARHPQRAMEREQNCRKRINDLFDPLVDFKLIDYKRKDNGYCGPGSDPYGCLGESRHSGVTGIGFRTPGNPAAQPAPFNYSR